MLTDCQGKMTPALVSGSLAYTIGILTSDNFKTVVDSEVEGKDVFKYCQPECEGTEGSV